MASKNDDVCENYLFLKPREATFWDVFRFILPSGSEKIKNLIDCPDGKEDSYTNFKARKNIFFTIMMLKFLLVVATPLQTLGQVWSKLMRGELSMMSDHSNSSANFRQEVTISKSCKSKSEIIDDLYDTTNSNEGDFRPNKVNCEDWKIMNLDDTSELYDNDFKYYGSLTMMASKLAYLNFSTVQAVVNDCWKMKLLGCGHYWNDFRNTSTTRAFMFENTAKDPNVTVVAFRGTDPFNANDWMVDLNFSWYTIKGVGSIHRGFLKALGLQKDWEGSWPKEFVSEHDFAYYTIRRKLRHIARINPKAKFIITGHSLGGALATLFVTLLAHHKESAILEKLQAVYTYGQPRVGDKQFKKFMESTIKNYGIKYYRYVYSCDLVPRVPFETSLFKYKHFGECVYFDCFHNGQFLKKQPNANYISILWLIPKYFAAWCMFIRSTIITPLFKGRAHFEGVETILVRFVGLLFPRLSAHICSNYVYLTRWGKIKHVYDNKKAKRFAHYIKKKNIKHLVIGTSVFALFVCSWRWSPPSFNSFVSFFS